MIKAPDVKIERFIITSFASAVNPPVSDQAAAFLSAFKTLSVYSSTR